MTKEHRIIREARRLAAENPDFVYKPPLKRNVMGELVEGDTCLYVHEGKGSCLFGRAMMNTGDITAGISPDNNDIGIGELLAKLRLRMPKLQRSWVSEVQHAQDVGTPWAEAIKQADESVGIFQCSVP